MDNIVSLPVNTITVQDVILDSPIWRANVSHLQDQIEQFEKWIDSFIRELKSYIDAIHKYNTQASSLCKCTFFHGLDDTLINDKIAGNVVSKFATALQSTIAHKSKMVSDLEEELLLPLQNLIKNDLNVYKNSRKQYEKALDKYENQFKKYYFLSKQKEASALREDAFQLYSQRKLYVTSSCDHFDTLISFKSNLENLLVECFSSALSILVDELEESSYSFQLLKSKIFGWKQWLDDSYASTRYLLNKLQAQSQHLQQMYMNQTKPSRSLKLYDHTNTSSGLETLDALGITTKNQTQNDQGCHGYLNGKLIAGRTTKLPWGRRWFFLQNGWFGTCTAATYNKEKGCILVNNCIQMENCQLSISTDTDRRFCFQLNHPAYTYYLQAETEEELQQWIWSIRYHKKTTQINTTVPNVAYRPPLLLSEHTMTKEDDGLPLVSISSVPSLNSTTQLKLSLQMPYVSTTIASLIALVLKVAASSPRSSSSDHTQQAVDKSNPLPQRSSWGMPWIGSVSFAGTSDDHSTSSAGSSPSTQPAVKEPPLLVWPMDVDDIPITRYSKNLRIRQRELKTLFLNVPQDEVVIDFFLATLQKPDEEEDVFDTYRYSGGAYMTQRNVWFYSCNVSTCIHMVVMPLEKICSLQLDHDSVLKIETKDSQVYFNLWLESPHIIYEKLNYMVKKHTSATLQELYSHVHSINEDRMLRSKASSNRMSAPLYTSAAPLIVQAQQVMVNPSATEEDDDDSHGSPAQGALAAVVARNQRQLDHIQSMKIKPSSVTITPAASQKRSSCSCADHLERIETDVVLAMSASQLFKTLFESTRIWEQLKKEKKCTEPVFTAWKDNRRTLEYKMPVTNPMVKAKEAEVNETQEVVERRQDVCYVVTVTTRTPTLPYADAFLPTIKYCITYETEQSCRLKCSIGVTWMKRILVKSIVQKAAMQGMQETIAGVQALLEVEKKTEPVVEKQEDVQEAVATKKANKRFAWIPMLIYSFCILCVLVSLYQSARQRQRLQHLFDRYDAMTMTWRGVYLKDIENDLFKSITDPSMEEFNMVRKDIEHYNYTWTHRQRQTMAMELNFSRERLGTIRFELLSVFRILNQVDQQLLENEYWNWVYDRKKE